ncbi:MAG: hypothetical protein ABIJ11_01145 [Elusimicrobiota bacterium]
MTTLPCHYEERSDEVICFVDGIASHRAPAGLVVAMTTILIF